MENVQKVAIVTGAGTGIGKCTSLALGQEGYAVVLAGRRVEPLAQTAEEAKQHHVKTLVVPTDVGDPVAVRNLFSKTVDAFGRLDLLFNNAGFGAPSILLEDLTFDQWQSVVNTNLTGSFLCTQEAFKIMKTQTPQGGRIINNGSVSAHVPRPNSAPYAATKHGITGLTKATSLDGRKYNIACGQIDIGNARTERSSAPERNLLQPNGDMALEATMAPENVANAVVYMASLSLEANVQFMTVMATTMPYIGRG